MTACKGLILGRSLVNDDSDSLCDYRELVCWFPVGRIHIVDTWARGVALALNPENADLSRRPL